MKNVMDDFLSDFEQTGAKRSVFADLFSQGVQVGGGCDEWTNYVTDDVTTALIVYDPIRITFGAARSSDDSILNSTITCDIPSVVADIVMPSLR